MSPHQEHTQADFDSTYPPQLLQQCSEAGDVVMAVESTSSPTSIEADDASRNETLFEAFLDGKLASLSRLTITSDTWHKANQGVSKRICGMDWGSLKRFVQSMFDVSHEETTAESLRGPLTDFEECMLSLLMLEHGGLYQATMGAYFDRSEKVALLILAEWKPLWDEIALLISYPPFLDDELLLKQLGWSGNHEEFTQGFPKGIFRNCPWRKPVRGSSLP